DFLGIPKQLGTVEGDDQESDDELSHPIENHPPQLEKSTEQNELTDIEQIYTDLEEPQVPGYPEPTQSTEYPEQPEPIPEAAAEKTEPEDFSALQGAACDANGYCTDYHPGYCCSCKKGYYGNGEYCLKKGENERIYGTLEGQINGVDLKGKQLHTFADTEKGRAYFALTKIPSYVGQPLLLVDEIGTVIGWLFAKVRGVFNRTINVHIGHRHALVVKQLFTGRDSQGRFQAQTGGDPCAPGRHQCTYPHMQCIEKDGKGSCICETGYSPVINASFTSLGWYCKDIDECRAMSHACDPNADCNNTEGSYECICKPGYTGNGRYCQSRLFHGCRTDADCHKWGECVAGEDGRKRCKCRGWYEGDGVTYCRIPESTTHVPGPHECGFYLCHKDADCVVLPSQTRACRCHEGFYGNGVSCEPRESLSGTTPPVTPAPSTSCNVENNCDRNADCVRMGNSYRCRCRDSYVGNGYTSQRIRIVQFFFFLAPEQQCDSLGNCGQYAYCDYDSQSRRYVCRCRDGYVGDGYSSVFCLAAKICRDKSECHPNAHCVFNAENSRYVCECLNGFDGDGVRECRRVAECNPAKPGVCHKNAKCEFDSDAGAFKCRCIEGFKGDGVSCHEIAADGCDRQPSQCHHEAQCTYSDEERRFVCVCKPGWIGDGYRNCQITPSQKCAQCSAHARCVANSDGEYGCECLPGYQGNGQVSSCLNDRSICDANAQCILNEQNHYVCNCNYGYRGNGRVCTRKGYCSKKFLAVTNNRDMLLIARGISIIERGMSQDAVGKQLIVRSGQVIVGLAYDCKEGRVYWTDIKGITVIIIQFLGPVHSAFLNGSSGIVVDASSRNFYYVDAQQNRPEIGVARLDGTYRKTLAKEGLNQPRYLALDMKNRHLYYSDWHRAHPVIGRMNLDGTENEAFIDTELNLPNGLAVLESRDELCWLDAGMHTLSCMGLRNRVRRTVYAPLQYPFGLTVHEDRQFFWTDWKDGQLHTVSIDGHGYQNFPITNSAAGKPYGLIAIPSSCKLEPTPCSVDNGGCPYLCLPGQHRAHCVQPDNVEGLEK
ncbi:unnamed protein product, partial [Enterobius vermicularis]|uniref:EGF-like domain-containing protein n=1 Tax=Enterobius vermicularis TaxID=51028 RepID=A0A158QAX2_ENTVE